MGLINDAPVAESVYLGDQSADLDYTAHVRGAVTTAAVGDTTRLTLRWTDPLAGAQVRNFDMLVLTTGVKIEVCFPLTQANGSDITYEVTHLAVVGSPVYHFSSWCS